MTGTVKKLDKRRINVADNAASPETPEGQRIRMNTGSLKSTYCNMVNATTTREEVVLNFGVNESWDRGVTDYEIGRAHV